MPVPTRAFPVPVPTRASCALAVAMVAVYVFAVCSRSDAQMSEIIRHQQLSTNLPTDVTNSCHQIFPLMSQKDRGVRGASLPSTWQQQKTLGKKMRTCSMHPAVTVRERTVKWRRPQRIYLVQADWVDLGKDVLYWRTGQARMAQHI